MSNENVGHRQRLRDRMLKEGLQNFKDHEILEMLLFQYIPRKDTNKLAHRLLVKFGSFANVLNADAQQLAQVEGISIVTACNIAMLKEVWLRYKKSEAEREPLKGVASITKYAKHIIDGSYTEKVVFAFVDHATKFITSEEVDSGKIDRVHIDVRKIVSAALASKAAGIIMFHCHVHGVCQPSADDVFFTEKLLFALQSMDIVLLDHIIFNSEGEHFSFYTEGIISAINKKFKNTISKK